MWRGLWAALAVVSCAEPLVCGEYTSELEGVCIGEVPRDYVEPEDPSFTQALADLTPCDRLQDTEGLDLEARCAGPVCLGRDVGFVVDQAGAGDCYAVGSGFRCTWDGVDVPVEDRNGDGEPDRDHVVDRFFLNGVRHASPEGLGVGASMSCFVETLGTPQIVGVVATDDGPRIGELYWDRLQLRVSSNVYYTRRLGEAQLHADFIAFGEAL